MEDTTDRDRDINRNIDRNEVVLSGRLSGAPGVKPLPSGDTLTTWKLTVRRPGRTRECVTETFECMTFDDPLGRSVADLRPRDVIEVRGTLRRRFFTTAYGRASVHSILADSVRVLERTVTVTFEESPPTAGPAEADPAPRPGTARPTVPRQRSPSGSPGGPARRSGAKGAREKEADRRARPSLS
ncbi:hypothetical protein C1I98_31260 [Spongiactinospora gelatinilytica]|uniref:Single-stranded DNA-binding protein n=1 Tax=Spongiactinospora gelatinilytica TaxID=2666298 RepID=A0A2W2GTV3_9ACTN|nr:single-stranded DNA-binding protein [Spongiactinospora gelatinilytica]PZG30334.1 hypothetical protein C1I98_31260 [Spongiactinospora gelatinilytica]